MGRKDSIAKLHQVLVVRREALEKALAGDSTMLKQLEKQTGGDAVDFALDSANEELNSQLAEVEARELEKIDTALEKLDDGTYGMCEGCNKAIPLARLKALPYATNCIECQRASEEDGSYSQYSKYGSHY